MPSLCRMGNFLEMYTSLPLSRDACPLASTYDLATKITWTFATEQGSISLVYRFSDFPWITFESHLHAEMP